MANLTKWRLWAVATVLALAWGNAWAMSVAPTNLVDLLSNSVAIFRGSVTVVSDGVDQRGLPYTEVSVNISESLFGNQSGTFTFRQIGLMAPRPTADGTKIMLPAPEGIPRYSVGQDVLLFMSQAASITGLQSTYGLGAGKFVFGGGSVENDLGNEGLFYDVSLDANLVTDNVQRMLDTRSGAVNPDDFMSLVRAAVQQNWVGSCQMWTTSVGKTCFHRIPPGPRPPTKEPTGTVALDGGANP